jgi:hypothetical protein
LWILGIGRGAVILILCGDGRALRFRLGLYGTALKNVRSGGRLWIPCTSARGRERKQNPQKDYYSRTQTSRSIKYTAQAKLRGKPIFSGMEQDTPFVKDKNRKDCCVWKAVNGAFEAFSESARTTKLAGE